MRLVLLILTALQAQAAAYVTIQSGNVSNTTAGQTPWATGACGGPPVEYTGGVPGDGDTVTICNGHTLTVDQNWTIGNSAAPSTPAIQTVAGATGTGILSVSTGFTVTTRANLTTANAAWTWAAGSGLRFNHSSTNLVFTIGDGSNRATAKLALTGSSWGSPVTVDKTPGTVNYKITTSSGVSDSGGYDFQYVSISDCGYTSHNCIYFSGDGTVAHPAKFQNVGFTNSMPVYIRRLGATDEFRWSSVVFASPAGVGSLHSDLGTFGAYASLAVTVNAALTSGTRLIENSWNEGQTYIAISPTGGATDCTITATGNVFLNWTGTNSAEIPLRMVAGTGCGGSTFTSNIVYLGVYQVDSMPLPPGTYTGNLYIRPRGQTDGNAHFLVNQTAGAAVTHHYDCVFEVTGAAQPGAGELLHYNGNPSTALTYIVDGCVIATSEAGITLPSGSLAATVPAGNASIANLRVEMSRNTMPSYSTAGAGAGPAVWQSEQFGTATVPVGRLASNLIWNPNGTPTWPGPNLIFQICTATPPCGVAPSGGYVGVDYNVLWGMGATNYYDNTSGAFTSSDSKFASPNPADANSRTRAFSTAAEAQGMFVDANRRLLTWCQWLDSTDTRTTCLPKFKRNSSWDARYNVPDLVNWIRQGYAPWDPSMATAGESGGRAGAVAPRLRFGVL